MMERSSPGMPTAPVDEAAGQLGHVGVLRADVAADHLVPYPGPYLPVVRRGAQRPIEVKRLRREAVQQRGHVARGQAIILGRRTHHS